MQAEERLLIHATNVTGLGASQVVSAIIEALGKSPLASSLDCYLPMTGPLAEMDFSSEQIRFHRFKRRLPNSISRTFECAFSGLYFPPYRVGITLGDIPIRTVAEQVVLVHQSHLVSPSIDVGSNHFLGMRIMRWLFRRNAHCAKHFVVQSEVMKAGLERTYPEIAGRVVVVPQPPPLWLRQQDRPAPLASGGGLTLFYPAAAYPHKNHRLFRKMGEWSHRSSGLLHELLLTLEPGEERRLAIDLPWLKNVGRLTPSECLAKYHRVDALFFPSVAESYGLPLVEAMTLGLPVLCSDRPFARWLCGAEAIYFDPMDPEDAWRAIADLEHRLHSDWRPDWKQALSKLPRSWNQVGNSFLELLGLVP
jgi:glycosyltransferase involved in cell wall biosynthesis